MTKAFIPEGYLPLSQAVLRMARAQKPDLWSENSMTAEEAAIYEGLGEQYEPFELQAAFCDEKEFNRLLISRGLNVSRERVSQLRRIFASPDCAKRHEAYKETEKLARRALHSKRLPFDLRSIATGQHYDAPAEMWGQANAINWFDDGQVFVPSGRTNRVPFGPYIPGAPDDVNFIEMPDGELFAILIPTAALEAFLIGATPPASVESEPQSTGSAPRRGRKTTAVHLAEKALWPLGVPPGLSVKDRDRAIIKWVRENGHSEPDSRTIRRYFNQ